MLRGSVVIFTGLFSVIFLKRKLGYHHYLGILLVMGGTAIVGSQVRQGIISLLWMCKTE